MQLHPISRPVVLILCTEVPPCLTIVVHFIAVSIFTSKPNAKLDLLANEAAYSCVKSIMLSLATAWNCVANTLSF